MAAVRHLAFLKVKFSIFVRVHSGVVQHRAKFYRGILNGCGDMAILNCSKWRPSAILDFKKSNFHIFVICVLALRIALQNFIAIS